MACLTFIQIQRKGSVHPIRVSRAFLKAGGPCVCVRGIWGEGGSWDNVSVEHIRTTLLVGMVAIGTGTG